MDKALEPIVGKVEKELGRHQKDVLNSPNRMPFYGFFKSKDSKVAIVALTARQWKNLSEKFSINNSAISIFPESLLSFPSSFSRIAQWLHPSGVSMPCMFLAFTAGAHIDPKVEGRLVPQTFIDGFSHDGGL